MKAEQKGVLKPDSLQQEAFIHFCEKNQIRTVLEFEDKPKEESVVLKVRQNQVEENLKYENSSPHLYREIKTQQVKEKNPLT